MVNREDTGWEIHNPPVDNTSVELGEFLNQRRGELHLVVLQDYPDPDAISSAFTYQLIGSQFGIRSNIIYDGKISHQQNLALVGLLGIDLIRYNDSLNFEQFDGAVFVDNQGTTCENIVQALEKTNIPELIVINHHEPQGRLDPLFSDIRRTGATATIFTGYLHQGLVEMDKNQKEHVRVATALLHGIMTDTGDFTRATDEDFFAAAYLSRFRDADILAQILSQSRSKQVMEIIHRALGNRITTENFSIAGIGYLRSEDRDAIPQVADFLLTEENIHTAIVYGIVIDDNRDERVIGSMRTSKITLDPDEFIKEVFGRDASGRYFGGGKVSAAGFEIPIGFLSGGLAHEFQELKWQVYDQMIKEKVYAKIGVQQTPKES